MSKGRAILIGVPATVLVVCLVGSIATRGVMSNLPYRRQGAGATTASGLVDQRPFLTAQALAGLAVTAEEQQLAREAERLADHEVDQAFAMALRQAEMQTRQLTGEALELQKKVSALGALVKEDQARVDGLTAQTTAAAKSGGSVSSSVTNDLELAKAQLQLETDELNDATEDLARASGDKRGQIQQELAARQQAMQKYDAEMAHGGETAVVSAKRFGTLTGRIGAWFDQRKRVGLLKQAKQDADGDVGSMAAKHAEIERKTDEEGAKLNGTASVDTDTAAMQSKVAGIHQMHALAQVHAILDDRQTTEQQLSAVYTKWITQVELQHQIVQHLILVSLAWVAGIVLFGMVAWRIAAALLVREARKPGGMDARTLHTLETVTRLGIQLISLAMVLLVLFGAPDHVPTILGLATAGLTVVFQDFILAFFGWFVLMGRNGIRVGDWVEINGVGGEVAEIGLFRTTLMETGNWTDKGHPTGRRVTFINNFAVSGQYFNFSTAGQWMWDEISVNVPAGEGSSEMIESIHKAVLEQTAKDTSLAEAEWKRATKPQGLSQFSAKPSVDLRPAVSGIDIIVRYVTRASERYDMRNRLFGAMIDVLHRPVAEVR